MTCKWTRILCEAFDCEDGYEDPVVPETEVKMASQIEDSSRISWFMGTIWSVQQPEYAKWREEVVVPCGKPVPSKLKASELMYNESVVYDTAQMDT